MIIKKLIQLKSKVFYLYEKNFGKENYGKFVVVTRSRTGSNLLISLLNSHKEIVAHGEKFRRLENKSSSDIYKEVFPTKSFIKCIGFKIFYYHPLDKEDKSIWDMIMNDPNIRIIHLVRDNLLRVHISRLIAEKTDVWAINKDKKLSVNNRQVHVDIEKLYKDFETTENYIENTRKRFENHFIIEVSYENLVKDQNQTLTNILKFLDISPKQLDSNLKKQNPEPIKSLVSNFEELYDELINTKYSNMLS